MGRRSREKRARRKIADMKTLQQTLNQSGELPPEVPDEFTNCIIQPMNSLLKFRGDEPKVLLKNGQLLVKCDRVTILPLEEYDQLLEAYQMVVRTAQAAQQRQAAAAATERLGIKPPGESAIVKPNAAQVAAADKLKT